MRWDEILQLELETDKNILSVSERSSGFTDMLTGQMLTPLSKKSDKCSQSHLKFRRRSSASWTLIAWHCWRYVECSLSWLYTHRLRLGAGQVEHDSYNVQVVVDAGAITSHFCSPLISPTMSLSLSRATVLRRLWSSHRHCRRKYESCLRIRPRLYKDVMR